MRQLDAGEGSGGVTEPFEPEHHVHPLFDTVVVLLNQVVQVRRGVQYRSPGQQLISFHLTGRPVRCRVAVQRDRFGARP